MGQRILFSQLQRLQVLLKEPSWTNSAQWRHSCWRVRLEETGPSCWGLLGVSPSALVECRSLCQFLNDREKARLGVGLQVDHGKERVECVVIGAGVVGLAVARELAKTGREVIVLEAANSFGSGTSSRNSEVIHAGIYYPPGSVKAKLCLEGKKNLYKYCEEHSIPHKNVGKLIVATSVNQVPVLERLATLGKANGLEDLCMVTGRDANQMEPSLQCVQALWSPSTGILDSHSFMGALKSDAEAMGASFAFNATVIEGKINGTDIEIGVSDSCSLPTKTLPKFCDVTLSAKVVVNAAGLSAQSVARTFKGFPTNTIPRPYFAKGCYFGLTGVQKPPFTRLIYPVPEDGGIGVHVTMDLQGQTRFGPDVEWLEDLDGTTSQPIQFDYSVDPKRAEKFYPEVRKYYPALADGSLQPGYAGIRPKISSRGQPPADFLIQGQENHGIPGLIHLYGIESPGLTSSLQIGKAVVQLLSK